MKTLMNVGFIGLGNMGSALAERLVCQEIQLHVYDPVAPAVKSFSRQGATVHESPHGVADAAEIVFACLPSQKVSMQVAYGPDGIKHGSKVRIYVETSTLGTEVIKNISQALNEKGITTLDAPITGGPARTRAGELTLLVAGPLQTIEETRPILSLIARKIHVLGNEVGMAQVMKLINNLLLSTNLIAAAEALTLGKKAGLTAETMVGVLRDGTGASVAGCDILGQSILSGLFNFGAAISILDKDTMAGLHEASLLEVSMPVNAQARETWQHAIESGKSDDDFTTIVKIIETLNQV